MLNTEFKKKLLSCHVWRAALYGSDTWTLRTLEKNNLKNFEMWGWRKMEKIKLSEKVTNTEVIERKGERKTLLNNILRRKPIRLDIF